MTRLLWISGKSIRSLKRHFVVISAFKSSTIRLTSRHAFISFVRSALRIIIEECKCLIYSRKKECALCRHPIETRRVLREDKKLKEISKQTYNLVNCLIPNIEKFNEVEDRIITNYLPTFCFKGKSLVNVIDSNHKQLQQDTADVPIPNEAMTNNIPTITSSQPTSTNNDFLQKKRKTESAKKVINKELTNININPNSKNNTIGVKLICDNNNEELKKYFSKTV